LEDLGHKNDTITALIGDHGWCGPSLMHVAGVLLRNDLNRCA